MTNRFPNFVSDYINWTTKGEHPSSICFGHNTSSKKYMIQVQKSKKKIYGMTGVSSPGPDSMIQNGSMGVRWQPFRR